MPRGVKGSGPAARGSRVALVEPVTKAPEVHCYVTGNKPVRVGEVLITRPGVEVPGAAGWPRIEAWVNSRLVKPATTDVEVIPFEYYSAMFHTTVEPEPVAELEDATSKE